MKDSTFRNDDAHALSAVIAIFFAVIAFAPPLLVAGIVSMIRAIGMKWTLAIAAVVATAACLRRFDEDLAQFEREQ